MLLKTVSTLPSAARFFSRMRSSPTTRTVLLVEQRDEVFARVSHDLAACSFVIERASTPHEACAKFADFNASLVIANRELSQEESGWLLVSKWALLRRQRRIWLYTAWPKPFDEHWCQFTRVEKLLYHQGDLWRLSQVILSHLLPGRGRSDATSALGCTGPK